MDNWNELVRRHGPLVYGTAWRILGHAADAEDIVQDVFMEAHRLRQSATVKSWPGLLRRLAACRALDRLRQRRNIASINGLSLSGTNDTPEAVAVGRELANRLREAIKQLPEREGEVFCLRYFEELSYEQIAESLDISPSAVSTALNKARNKLEALLSETPKGETV